MGEIRGRRASDDLNQSKPLAAFRAKSASDRAWDDLVFRNHPAQLSCTNETHGADVLAAFRFRLAHDTHGFRML